MLVVLNIGAVYIFIQRQYHIHSIMPINTV